MAVVPREAKTTPCSPADCIKCSRSEGRASAGAAVSAPTETIWGARGSGLVVAQSECSKTRATCLLDLEYVYGGMAYFCLHIMLHAHCDAEQQLQYYKLLPCHHGSTLQVLVATDCNAVDRTGANAELNKIRNMCGVLLYHAAALYSATVVNMAQPYH